jgi:hypothetical protein
MDVVCRWISLFHFIRGPSPQEHAPDVPIVRGQAIRQGRPISTDRAVTGNK